MKFEEGDEDCTSLLSSNDHLKIPTPIPEKYTQTYYKSGKGNPTTTRDINNFTYFFVSQVPLTIRPDNQSNLPEIKTRKG